MGTIVNGKIWGLRQRRLRCGKRRLLLKPLGSISQPSVKMRPGTIYVADYGGGEIYRIVDQS